MTPTLRAALADASTAFLVGLPPRVPKRAAELLEAAMRATRGLPAADHETIARRCVERAIAEHAEGIRVLPPTEGYRR